MKPHDGHLKRWARDLLTVYPYPGASGGGIIGVLRHCDFEEIESGVTIIREGEATDRIIFLLEGFVEVFKRDLNGDDQRVLDISSPTILGHLGMADGSPRSATCVSKGIITIASLSMDAYNTLLHSNEAGTAFRRLLLSTMTRQLLKGNERLYQLMAGKSASARPKLPAAPPTPSPRVASRRKKPEEPEIIIGAPLDEEPDVTQEELLQMAGVLQGWNMSTRGVDDVQVMTTEDDLRRGYSKKEWS